MRGLQQPVPMTVSSRACRAMQTQCHWPTAVCKYSQTACCTSDNTTLLSFVKCYRSVIDFCSSFFSLCVCVEMVFLHTDIGNSIVKRCMKVPKPTDVCPYLIYLWVQTAIRCNISSCIAACTVKYVQNLTLECSFKVFLHTIRLLCDNTTL